MPIGWRRPWLVALGAAAMVAAAVASSVVEQVPAAAPADRPAHLGLHLVQGGATASPGIAPAAPETLPNTPR